MASELVGVVRHRRRGVGAHAAGVRAGVALADALVVLGQRQGARPCGRRTGRAASTPARSSAPRARTARRRARIAAIVSASSSGTVTPLPAASPSSLTTTGRPSVRHHAIAASTSPAGEAGERRAGMPERRRQLAGVPLRRLQPASAAVGPKHGTPRAAHSSATPATSAASGPGMTRSSRGQVDAGEVGGDRDVVPVAPAGPGDRLLAAAAADDRRRASREHALEAELGLGLADLHG